MQRIQFKIICKNDKDNNLKDSINPIIQNSLVFKFNPDRIKKYFSSEIDELPKKEIIRKKIFREKSKSEINYKI